MTCVNSYLSVLDRFGTTEDDRIGYLVRFNLRPLEISSGLLDTAPPVAKKIKIRIRIRDYFLTFVIKINKLNNKKFSKRLQF